MGVNGTFDGITRDDLLEFGDRFVVPSPGDLIGRVTQAVARWPEFADQAGVPGDVTADIGDAHHRLGLGA